MNAGDEAYDKNNPREGPRSDSKVSAADECSDAVADRLYPALSEGERRMATANLRRYFEIALAVAEEQARVEAELTQPESIPTMKERSNADLKL
jgi:hypothetical protein